MFRPDPRLRSLPVKREQVSALAESINQVQIQIPGRGAQPAAAHLCGVRNADGSRSVYVSLHLPASSENVVYVHERGALSGADYEAAEREGLAFLESMGFILDDLQFAALAPEVQDEALRRVPLFAPAAPPPKAAATTSEPAAPSPLARLLSNL